jgi:hypothetical protein
MVDSWVSWLKILDDPRAAMTCETLSYHSWKFGFKPTLVGGFKATPLKNMTSSVGMMTFPRYGKIKSKCSKPPTSTCDNYEHQWHVKPTLKPKFPEFESLLLSPHNSMADRRPRASTWFTSIPALSSACPAPSPLSAPVQKVAAIEVAVCCYIHIFMCITRS